MMNNPIDSPTNAPDLEFERDMELAREFMKKRRGALRALAIYDRSGLEEALKSLDEKESPE